LVPANRAVLFCLREFTMRVVETTTWRPPSRRKEISRIVDGVAVHSVAVAVHSVAVAVHSVAAAVHSVAAAVDQRSA